MSQLLQNAAYGTALILAAALLRRALRDRLAPEARLALWGVCLFRLLTPAAPSSVLSLWGLFQTQQAPAPESMPAPASTCAPQVYAPAQSPAPAPAAAAPPVPPAVPWEEILMAVWLTVGAVLAVRYLLSWERTRREVACTIPLDRSGARYTLLPAFARLREGVMAGAPLTFGAVRPTVVLSPGLDGLALDCVLAHEGVHARRRDNLWHYAAALALAVHWWNPAVWLMARLLRRDVELSCDRAALKILGEERRADYATTLLNLAAQTGSSAFCHSFGRKAAEERIISIMKFKKTSLIGVILSLVLVLCVTVAFASNPKEQPEDDYSSDLVSSSSAEILRLNTSGDGLYDVSISLEALERALNDQVPNPLAQEDADRILALARDAAYDESFFPWDFPEDSGLVLGPANGPGYNVFRQLEDGSQVPVTPESVVEEYLLAAARSLNIDLPYLVDTGASGYNEVFPAYDDLGNSLIFDEDGKAIIIGQLNLDTESLPLEQYKEALEQWAADNASEIKSRLSRINDLTGGTQQTSVQIVVHFQPSDYTPVAVDLVDESGLPIVRNSTGDIRLCDDEACDVGSLHYHLGDEVIHIYYQDPYTDKESRELDAAQKEAAACFRENGYDVDESGYALVRDGSGSVFMRARSGYLPCVREDCAIAEGHYHKNGEVIYTFSNDPGLVCTFEDCHETEYHQHNGLTYKPILNICTREDCGDTGVHMHGGVYYRGWTSQPVTGPIANPSDTRNVSVTEPDQTGLAPAGGDQIIYNGNIVNGVLVSRETADPITPEEYETLMNQWVAQGIENRAQAGPAIASFKQYYEKLQRGELDCFGFNYCVDGRIVPAWYVSDRAAAGYPRNSKGETYGPDVPEVYGCSPDLIAAIGSRGEEGYVRWNDQPGANVSSPEEALEYMEWLKTQPSTIPVPLYDSEGNVIGQFNTSNGESGKPPASAAPTASYPVCHVDGCALEGLHDHNGVTYCGGPAHLGDTCDGSCVHAAQQSTASGGAHHAASHHGSNSHH